MITSTQRKTKNIAAKSITKPKKTITYHRLSDIEYEEVKWLWYPYIPAAKLSIIEGDPGLGKSWITCALAADISQGRKLPGAKEPLPPQKVLMLSAEDGLGDTVRPRIEALNGNMDLIYVSDDFFVLDTEGLRQLEDLMRTVAATIVFMDPIVSYMGSRVDMHKANEVRGLMTPLATIAKQTGCAIVAVRHLRKSHGKERKAIYSGIGSIDFTAAVRSVVQVAQSRGETKFMFHAKHNLSPPGDTLAYSMDNGEFKWQGTVDVADLQTVGQTVNTTPRMQLIAERFLFDILKDGAKSALEIYQMALEAKIPKRTLDRAKKGLAHSEKWNNEWVWVLNAREGTGK